MERLKGAKWSIVDPRLVLLGGDEIRFRYRANRASYLYVINHDGQGRNTWLFPTPDTGEQNIIEPGKDYIIPATGGVFQIAERPGYETTYWILSPEELRGRKTLNPDIVKSDDGPLLPRCGSGSGAGALIARGGCIDDHAGARRSRSTPIPKWFENEGSLQARDLKVDNNAGQSRVRLDSAFDAPFIYEFRIAHQ